MVYGIGYITRDSCSSTNFSEIPKCHGYYNTIYDYMNLSVKQREFIHYDQLGTLKYEISQNDNSVSYIGFHEGTLLGDLATGKIDTAMTVLLATQVRLDHLSFASPYRYDRLCMFSGKPKVLTPIDSPWYFVRGFTPTVWFLLLILGLVTIVLHYCILMSTRRQSWLFWSGLRESIIGTTDIIVDTQLYFLPMTFWFICYLYNLSMCANFVKAGRYVPPFRDINTAIESIARGEYRLSVKTTDNYIFEIINASQINRIDSKFSRLGTALGNYPPKIIGGDKKCPLNGQLLLSKDIIIESEINLCLRCNLNQIESVYSVCVSGFPMMAGHMFRRGSSLVERASRAVQFLKIHDYKANEGVHLQDKLNLFANSRLFVPKNVRNSFPVLTLKAHLDIIVVLFWCGMGFSFVLFLVEFIKHKATVSRD